MEFVDPEFRSYFEIIETPSKTQKLRCTLTGHELPVSKEKIAEYLQVI